MVSQCSSYLTGLNLLLRLCPWKSKVDLTRIQCGPWNYTVTVFRDGCQEAHCQLQILIQFEYYLWHRLSHVLTHSIADFNRVFLQVSTEVSTEMPQLHLIPVADSETFKCFSRYQKLFKMWLPYYYFLISISFVKYLQCSLVDVCIHMHTYMA